MSEWQPIETVLKDGTRVVLAAEPVTLDDRWTFWEDSWRTYLDGIHEGWGRATLHPTHWMPLPKLPAMMKKLEGSEASAQKAPTRAENAP